jgi:hypothetical protein
MIVPALSSHGLCAALFSKSCGSLSNQLDMIAELFLVLVLSNVRTISVDS